MPVLGDLLGRVRLKNQKTGLGEFRTLSGSGATAGLVPLPDTTPIPREVPANAGGGLFQQLLSALQGNPDSANRIPTMDRSPVRNQPVAPQVSTNIDQSGIRSDLENSIQPVKPIQPLVSTRPRRNRQIVDPVDRNRQRQQQIRDERV